MLFADCNPFCALQVCFEGVQVETVMSEIDIFVSSTGITTLDHIKKLTNNTFVGNTGHFDSEIDGSEFLEGLEVGNITPQMIFSSSLLVAVCSCNFRPTAQFVSRQWAAISKTNKVWSPTASAKTTRQVEISTLSAHQMAPAGVFAHFSTWTPAAYELEESSVVFPPIF